jgi:uncharacterized protein
MVELTEPPPNQWKTRGATRNILRTTNIPEVSAMRREEIIKLLGACKPELSRYGVSSLAVFGSVARNEVGPDSDVDILVDFESPPSFDTYMSLKLFLEDLLGRGVDLATPRSLRPQVRAYVERDAVYVA